LFLILRIAIDPVFPPPEENKWLGGKKDNIRDNMDNQNRFELIFDELLDGREL